MNGVSPSPSSLDAPNYDPIDDLNAIFSHPSTLNSIARTSDVLQSYQLNLDDDIASLVAAQAYSNNDSVQRMQSAKAELAELFRKIESVRERAIQTEQTITDMTADIKRLDGTKRNLTLSMTALKRLQMLTTAYEQLRSLSRSRQYRECASLLQAVIQLMAHFRSYRSIDQIATLSRNVADVQRELLEQVCEDFEIAFAKGEVASRKSVLAESCLVMDALGDNARARLVTWYCNTQLREYRQVFRGNDEAGSLDNIGRRYSWFKRMLKTYDDEHAALFPREWRVNEMLANAFCEGTRDDFKGILSREMRRTDGGKVDVILLLSCLQETMDFEQLLEKKFAGDPRASIDTLASLDEKPQTFDRSISEAFEPYLSLWVESQDKMLASMMPKYRAQPLMAEDEEFTPQSVIPSAIELFHFYKVTLAQCSKLSTSDHLLELAKILAKYLDVYAQQVLFYFLQRPGGQGKDGSAPRLQDIILVLNTADFWHTNTTQLEENIQRRIDSDYRERIDFSSQCDAFMGVASASILALVTRVESECEASWREMRNINWSKMESVGDQSSYVAEVWKNIKDGTMEVLPLVQKQQFARAFCDNLVEHLAQAYVANIVQCRPVSEVGAEQMLLDKYVLTKHFTTLIVLASNPERTSTDSTSLPQPPLGFVKRVNSTMTRIDPLLKTLQVRPSPPEALVQAYLIHIADKSDTNFKKILELKGVRKQDQAHLTELYQIHREGTQGLVENSPLLTALQLSSNSSGGMVSSGIPGLNTPTRFDPTTFGTAIMNAANTARDGIERIGTGTPVNNQGISSMGGATLSRVMSPPRDGLGEGEGKINENLRNIGKFFRRDVGGFGGRFGTRNSVEERR